MRLLTVAIALTLATACFADTITLKNGRVINGTYLGGTARTIRVDVGDRVETVDVSDVARIEFRNSFDDGRPTMRRSDSAGSTSDRPTLRRAPGSDSDSDQPTLRRADNSDSSDDDRPILRRSDNSGGGTTILHPDAPIPVSPPAAPARDPVELPAGTNFVVRMINGVDSDRDRVGATFSASIDEPVKAPSGDILVDRGADAVVKLVDTKESGKLTGKAELTLMLVSFKVAGKMVDINTQTVSRESSSRGEKTAKVAGGGAVVGAVLGGIFGGGKGAVAGAAAGGATGAGVQVLTKGQTVKVPSETRLSFVLDSPVQI